MNIFSMFCDRCGQLYTAALGTPLCFKCARDAYLVEFTQAWADPMTTAEFHAAATKAALRYVKEPLPCLAPPLGHYSPSSASAV